MDKRYFSLKIVDWYLRHKRDLPWRDTKDPYKIWLSEIILQQTRVLQGLPYYNRFIEKYPNVFSLANAPEQEVLRLWQGLGYYTRARNLHKCAKTVVMEFNGKFPENSIGLKKLPGIGEYTAAAIASFSFGEPIAVVDGNVFRVLSRIYGIDTPINSPAAKKEFSALANQLISTSQPDLHNQAMMEFGATLCTPKNPSCSNCPFQQVCHAYKNDLQQHLPVKEKSKASRKRYLNYLVFDKGGALIMKKRIAKDIWHGLYDFPLLEEQKAVSIKKLLKGISVAHKIAENKIVVSPLYKHILTHQTIYCRFVVINSKKIPAGIEKGAKFYSPAQIADLPKPVLITKFLEENTFHS